MPQIQPTYYFYDLETSGLNKCFDQAIQFAGIRTDLNFNEIERHEIIIKLKDDVIPCPLASITHRFGIKDLDDGISEYDAMLKIHEYMNTPGTISVGYNTLSFDDEFLRFSFFRNLLTPYTHQYANQCYRMDVYPMTVMYYLFKEDALEWPIKNGSPSLKLDRLNELNKLAEGQAHNAMVDVLATIELAKKLYAKDPAMWNYLTGYFNKKVDTDRQLKLPTVNLSDGQVCHQGILVLPRMGAKYAFHSPVIGLGQHHHYKNQYCWLRLDQKELKNATLDNVDEKAFVVNKKLGEVGFIMPYTEKYLAKMKDKRQDLAAENIAFLQENPAIFEAIKEHYCQFKYPLTPDLDVSASLYQSSFWTKHETSTLNKFHAADPDDKIELLHKIDNPDISELGERLMAVNFPELATESMKDSYQSHLKAVWGEDDTTRPMDFRRDKQYSLNDAKADFEVAEKMELDEQQKAIIVELKSYLASRN